MSVAFFAALATAHQHPPQHFHQRRQYNTTAPHTTLTVFATSVYTITSCAASITDCPARTAEATSEAVVTSVVALTTTVCPVAEAESASSAILASYTAGSLTPATGASATSKAAGVVGTPAPMGTGYPQVPQATGTGSGSPESVVLTYTLGSGISTTVVTTTIKHYQTATVYAAVSPVPEASLPEASGKQGDVVTGADSGPTTTYTSTSTSTRYITVKPVSSGASALGVASDVPVASGGAQCAPVTVTVTNAALTVTVTETASPVAGTGYPVAATSTAAGEVNPGGPVHAASSVAATASSPASNVVVIASTATVVPIPVATGGTYPMNNGTEATSTKSIGASTFPSSGFVSVYKASSTAAASPIAYATKPAVYYD